MPIFSVSTLPKPFRGHFPSAASSLNHEPPFVVPYGTSSRPQVFTCPTPTPASFYRVLYRDCLMWSDQGRSTGNILILFHFDIWEQTEFPKHWPLLWFFRHLCPEPTFISQKDFTHQSSVSPKQCKSYRNAMRGWGRHPRF